MVVKRVGVASVARIYGAISAAFGLLFGLLFALGSVIGAGFLRTPAAKPFSARSSAWER